MRVIPRALASVIMTVVTLVWAVTITAPLWHPTYVPPPAIHAVFMAIVGGALALRRGPDHGGTAGRVMAALRPPPPPPPEARPHDG